MVQALCRVSVPAVAEGKPGAEPETHPGVCKLVTRPMAIWGEGPFLKNFKSVEYGCFVISDKNELLESGPRSWVLRSRPVALNASKCLTASLCVYLRTDRSQIIPGPSLLTGCVSLAPPGLSASENAPGMR